MGRRALQAYVTLASLWENSPARFSALVLKYSLGRSGSLTLVARARSAQIDGQELSCPAELPQPVTRATFVKAAHGGDIGQWVWVPAVGKVYSLSDPYGDTGRKLVDSPAPIGGVLEKQPGLQGPIGKHSRSLVPARSQSRSRSRGRSRSRS